MFTMSDQQACASAMSPYRPDAVAGGPQPPQPSLLDAVLHRLQQSMALLSQHNEQLERMAGRLTGEAPSTANPSKGQTEPGAVCLMHAIDMQCIYLEQELSRQQDALQRLGRL